MIGIVDSGGTKSKWAFLKNGAVRQLTTAGIHPYFQSSAQMKVHIEQGLAEHGPLLEKLYIYSAGIGAADLYQQLLSLYQEACPQAMIQMEWDILGAARACAQRSKAVVAILGTGANTGWYDGVKLHVKRRGYGFILGDEGSGAVLGKAWLKAYLYNDLPEPLRQEFETTFGFTTDEFLEQVYKGTNPNRFLASFSPFIKSKDRHPFVQSLLKKHFATFFDRMLAPYSDELKKYPLHLCGSIAWHYQSYLHVEALQRKIRLGEILDHPMNGLIQFHSLKE